MSDKPKVGYTIVANSHYGTSDRTEVSFLAVNQEKSSTPISGKGEEIVYSMAGIYPDKMFSEAQVAEDFYLTHAEKLEKSYGVIPGSFKIVKVTYEIVKDLKPADEIADEVIKRQALAKLTDEEKELLGLNTKK